MGVVYAIYNTKDGKIFYVGATDNFHSRQLAHKSSAKNKKITIPLYLYIRKYKIKFDFKILCEYERMDFRGRWAKERRWMRRFTERGYKLINKMPKQF